MPQLSIVRSAIEGGYLSGKATLRYLIRRKTHVIIDKQKNLEVGIPVTQFPAD